MKSMSSLPHPSSSLRSKNIIQRCITFPHVFAVLLSLSSFLVTPSQGGLAGWCGSGDDRCTSYPAYADTYGSYCAVDDVYKFVGSDKGVGVWQSNGASDVWRIHSCDGMGLMFDVQDASFYVEHMDGADQGSPQYNDCSWTHDGNCGSGDEYNKCAACMHTQSTFVHPGTSQTYSNYWAGQWQFCDDEWPDAVAGKKWFPTMQSQGLQHPKEYGCHDAAATLYVILYPWVCNYNSDRQNGSELWGDDSNWANGLPFGNPETYNVDCYYDNEPWDLFNGQDNYNPHYDSDMPPPVYQVYKFIKQNDDDPFITGWLIGEKTLNDQGFVDKTGGQSFTLDWQYGA